jgi:hypothetical protein
MHLSAKAVANDCGDIPGVVEVRMRQHDRVDGCWFDRERLTIPIAQLLVPLKQPAVDKDSVPVRLNEVARARHRVGCAKKGHRGR